jgi:60 kDa SS-A/Ro ribonucleoprotein
MSKYLKNVFNQTRTPQSAPIPGTNQVQNSAGGYAWAVDEWKRLQRFLILGSEGGSYYSKQQALTADNANNVLKCLQADGARVVRETVAISDAGRAPKNSPAIFVLALAAGLGDDDTRKAALAAIPQVCRTGTHLFEFATYVQGVRGWGRGLRRGVAGWYQGLEARRLAYQTVKYRQRDGWTHTDLLRLAHPNPVTDAHGAIYKWITRREEAEWATSFDVPRDEALAFIWAFEKAQTATELDTILKLIREFDLPREALPTQWLNEAAVWAVLLDKMPMTAMLRNLGVMSKVGLLKPNTDAARIVIDRLTDANRLKKARIHPIALLSALRVYAGGKGLRGKGEWTPVKRVIDALDDAFYLAFQNVEPTNKRHLLALDVSGSMTFGTIAGVPGLTPRDGSAAMALVTAKTEPQYDIVAFSHEMTPLNISARMRLDDAVKAVSGLPFGGTDCALPMIYALESKIKVDTFVVMTDSETWFNQKIHPAQALAEYRDKMGIPAQLIVVGMIANNFSIADPNDSGMLDIIGFDSAAPQIMADFARGTL